MSETPHQQYQQYRPGDVANGHMLGNDGQWYPLGAVPMQPALPTQGDYAPASPPRQKASYGAKYKRRWIKCFTILGVITGLASLSVASHEALLPGLIDVVIGAGVGGLLYGSIVCLIAAAFPGDEAPSKPEAAP